MTGRLEAAAWVGNSRFDLGHGWVVASQSLNGGWPDCNCAIDRFAILDCDHNRGPIAVRSRCCL